MCLTIKINRTPKFPFSEEEVKGKIREYMVPKVAEDDIPVQKILGWSFDKNALIPINGHNKSLIYEEGTTYEEESFLEKNIDHEYKRLLESYNNDALRQGRFDGRSYSPRMMSKMMMMGGGFFDFGVPSQLPTTIEELFNFYFTSYDINYGFHSYHADANLGKANNNEIISEFIIPKGSLYFSANEGANTLFCSDKIFFTSIKKDAKPTGDYSGYQYSFWNPKNFKKYQQKIKDAKKNRG